MKETEILLLVEYLGKGALIIAIGFFMLRPLRRQVAAVKHQVWIGLFAAVIALPVVLAFPRWGLIPRLESSVSSPDRSALAAGLESPFTSEAPTGLHTAAGVEPAFSAVPVETSSFHWGMFVVVWKIGMLVVLARMGLAWIFLSQLKRRMRPISPETRIVADALLDEFAIRQEVSISISDQVATPFVWGVCRPRVVLPCTVEQWSASQLDMVLRHELSHVKRWDAASLFVSRLFFALNWVNPLAWIASRQAMRFREEACDQMVLAGGHQQSDYAALLLSQAKLSNRSLLRTATISMAEIGTVERRIREVLSATRDTRADDHPRGSHRRTAGLSLLAVVLLTIFVGLTGVSQAQKDQARQDAKIAAIESKLDSIIIPDIELQDTPLSDAIKFLQQRSAEIDTAKDPESRGVDFILKGYDKAAKTPRITLKLKNVPLRNAVRYITALAQREFTVEANAIVIGEEKMRGAAKSSVSTAAVSKREYNDEEKEKIAAIEKKLSSLVMASVEFRDTPLKDALDFIVHRSKELDKDASDTAERGINCVLMGDPKAFEATRINLQLKNVSLRDILRYTAKLAGMAYQVQPDAVVLADRTEFVVNADAKNSSEVPATEEKAAMAEIEKKLKSIIIPSIEFSDTPLVDALEFLQQRSVELDAATTDPERKGVNVILDGKGEDGGYVETKITLKLSNVPLAEAFRYTAKLAQYEITIEPQAMVVSRIGKKDENSEVPLQFAARRTQQLRVDFIGVAQNGAYKLQRLPSASWKKADPVEVQIGDTCLQDQLKVLSFKDDKLSVTHLETGRNFVMQPGKATHFDIYFAELKCDAGKTFYVKEGQEVEIPGSTGKPEWRVVEVLEKQCTIVRESDKAKFTLKIIRKR